MKVYYRIERIDKHTSWGYVMSEAAILDPEEQIATWPGPSLSTVVLSRKHIHFSVNPLPRFVSLFIVEDISLPLLAMYSFAFSYTGNWMATWVTPAKEGRRPLLSWKKQSRTQQKVKTIELYSQNAANLYNPRRPSSAAILRNADKTLV